MRRNSASSIGALHPVLFFLCVYGVSLFLAVFVCRTIYNVINHEPTIQSFEIVKKDTKDALELASVK